jgi:hypothetical protein
MPPVVAGPAVPPGPWAPPAEGAQTATGQRNGHRRRAALALCAAALVLVAGGIGATLTLGQSNNASASEAVAQAATQTINAQSADMSMSMNLSLLGQQESFSGSGAFDFAHHTGSMTISYPVQGTPITEQAIYDGSTVYVNLGSMFGGLTQGKQWVSADLSQFQSAGSAASGLNAFGDPAAMLQQLQSIGGTVTSRGPATYDGTSVTHYAVSIPPSALLKQMGPLSSSVQKGLSAVNLPTINADVYITGDGLLKAMHMPMSFSAAGQSVSMDLTMSFSNYGTPVSVTPPPASEVIPLSQLGNGLGGLGGGNTGSTGNSGNTGVLGNSGGSI